MTDVPVTGALACWCTLMALAPLRRPLALGAMSFLSGFVLNELPFAAFYYLLASTLLAIDGIDSPGGWAAAGLAALATAGLILVAWRGVQAGPAAARLLIDGPVVAANKLTGFSGRWLADRGLIVAVVSVPVKVR